MTEPVPADLRGTPREVGRQHGEGLRDRIASALGLYALALGRGEAVA